MKSIVSPERPLLLLSELESALEPEIRVLGELRDILAEQRAAVAAGDREGIEASVEALGRTLLGLETARRHRRSLLDAAGLGGIDSLEALERAGVTLPEWVRDTRARLRETAALVGRELAVNQQLLRGALDAGEAFLQEVFATAALPLPARGAAARADTRRESTLLPDSLLPHGDLEHEHGPAARALARKRQRSTVTLHEVPRHGQS